MKLNSKILFTLLSFITITTLSAQTRINRWSIKPNGSISWLITEKLPHNDHIEMSGKFISTVVRYGVKADSSWEIRRDAVWPMLRTLPNNTHASLIRSFTVDPLKMVYLNGRLAASEKVSEVVLNGTMTVKSLLDAKTEAVRTYFPSTDLPVFCEKYELKNMDKKAVIIEVPEISVTINTLKEKGLNGVYTVKAQSLQHGTFTIQPDESMVFYLQIIAGKEDENFTPTDIEKELVKRQDLLNLFSSNLILETPDDVLNRTFAFAKIRAAESIFQTKGGPMHAPGGISYYAAIWANDQAEYINPFFPYLGYPYGIESAINAYRHFARFMNPEFKPIPSSIIAEGTDIWNGAGDRGDAAMIAYGAARFALSSGDRKMADELWTLIEWCLEYNKRKLNANGVVSSDTDELEGRFPAGDANLCTSSLYYDALISAAYLGKALGKDKAPLTAYLNQASTLKQNIEKFFGARVMGFDTYRYYDGNDILRAWICMPLTVGIYDRSQGTVDALFSPDLWTDDGLATASGDKTFWDRATLYALRGVFASGNTKRGLKFLQYYSNRRLLGEHVPYAVEAFPEGNQRHLSAESALYGRVFTEGLFGIRPTGLNSFNITPQLPDDWNFMRMKQLHGFGTTMDIEVVRKENSKVHIVIKQRDKIIFDKTINNGETGHVKVK